MCCEINFLICILKMIICLYSTYNSFLVTNVCNQGKTLCSLCIFHLTWLLYVSAIRHLQGAHKYVAAT